VVIEVKCRSHWVSPFVRTFNGWHVYVNLLFLCLCRRKEKKSLVRRVVWKHISSLCKLSGVEVMTCFIAWEVSIRKSVKRSCFQKRNIKDSLSGFSPLTTTHDSCVSFKIFFVCPFLFIFACCRTLDCAIERCCWVLMLHSVGSTWIEYGGGGAIVARRRRKKLEERAACPGATLTTPNCHTDWPGIEPLLHG